MIKILFCCHGNICRSPMAEYVMKHIIDNNNLSMYFDISSAAVSREEIGNPVYPPARKKLQEHGISCEGHSARQMTKQDYEYYDYIVGMDASNMNRMLRICDGDPDHKLSLLLDYTDHPGSVADPWYTGDFDATWDDVVSGCEGLLKYIKSTRTFDK